MSPAFGPNDRRIDLADFKRRLIDCLETVEVDRVSLVIFRHGRPYLKLVPWGQANPEVTANPQGSVET